MYFIQGLLILWPGTLESDYDKTSYEDFLNHIHIDGYIPDSADEFDYLKFGLEFSSRLHEKLSSTFPNSLRITVSFSQTTYNGNDIDTYGGCVVKFYSIRQSPV